MDKKKILIVDDEPEFVGLLKTRLEANNYEVMTALNGEEGLKKAEEGEPDLILLDILMPKKDGYTFLLELKKNDPAKFIPVIVITAKPDMRNLFQIEGVDDYLVKPFGDDELLLRITKSLKL